MSAPIKTTIVFPKRGDQVLLGMKKRGFGAGWWNGFGGKLEKSESFEDNARRETLEEVGLRIAQLHLVARLLFYFEQKLKVVSAAYISTDFSGEPLETEEMKPKWFNFEALPYETMWPADKLWIPRILQQPSDSTILNLSVYFDANRQLDHLKDISPSDTEAFFLAN